MTKKIELVPQWTGYQGNKRKLIPLIMSLTPKRTATFVDLFGGTGIVGANAFRFNRCKKVVYNDLEYDLVKTMKFMHDCDPEAVVESQNRLIRNAFGDVKKITPDKYAIYQKLLDEYNERRLMLWDEKRREDDFGEAYEMKTLVDSEGDAGDWDSFLFLVKHSMWQTPNTVDYGRRLTLKPRENAALKIDDRGLLGFCKAWHETPVDFFSCNFTSGFLPEMPHKRPRPQKVVSEFWDMMANLTSEDFVFIDPPYHGSSASYNKGWKLTMEVYLMAFCQMLNERKIPFLITNNLAWNKTLFNDWRKQFHCYMLREDSVHLYQRKAANKMEVFVSNKSLPKSKYKIHADLVRMPKEDPENIEDYLRKLKEEIA